MRISLSEHFNFKKLLLFVLPSICMVVFTSIYSVVDGLFVSNFVGKSAFSAINLIMPVTLILGTFGLMLGTGGSAIVAKTMGEGDDEKAKRIFSMLVIVVVAISFLFIAIAEIFLPQIATLLKAEGETHTYCVIYGRIIVGFLVFYMLQFVFQSFMVVAEKATLGLILTVVAGVLNMALDAMFIIVFKWGIAGAAIATGVSQVFAGLSP